MGCCLVAKLPDQHKFAQVVFYLEVVMRLVLEKVNTNFLLWTTKNIIWDEGLHLLVGFVDWQMSQFLMYC